MKKISRYACSIGKFIFCSFGCSLLLFSSVIFADVAVNSGTSSGGASQSGGIMSMLPMIAVLAVAMYFLIIRPQSKRTKEQKDLLSKIQEGVEVVTIGGIIGKIEKIKDNFVLINTNSGKLLFQRNAISNILPNGTMKSVIDSTSVTEGGK